MNVLDRFEEKYVPEPNSGCFIWTGGIGASGYGRFFLGGRNWTASRVAWRLKHGDPGSLHVLHRCDNRLCVNPDHLFLGDNADNTADKVAKGRQSRLFGARNPKAKLDEMTVREIRQMLANRASGDVTAARFGVSKSTVSKIKKGRVWSHVQ